MNRQGRQPVGKAWRLSDFEKRLPTQIRKERAEIREVIVEAKRRPCADCGVRFASEAMEFDHVPGRGGKLFALSRSSASELINCWTRRGRIGSLAQVRVKRSVRAVLAEIAKCDVVCANCHRVRTRKRRHQQRAVVVARQQRIEAIVAEVERQREEKKGL